MAAMAAAGSGRREAEFDFPDFDEADRLILGADGEWRAGIVDQQGQPGLHVPSQHWPPVRQKSPTGQHTPPHWTLHISMMVPAEFRMTASQCTMHPT